ncbi:hypothetical protein [Tsukamurella pseudospumae]|uniref:Uncharacterized protein n=1 Tax=Tsukamurella pseudospumae TaxID=239498 RepID=A0A138AU09_9ACTN|nr:hypothetical protein [Tsukamurella pseudospumae]KXP13930.1 hypothetical protein AXK60_22770 [Tsukamurella pseudospumae]
MTDFITPADSDLTAVIHNVLRSARRTLADADLARDIETAVREHLAVECRDGYTVAPDVTATPTERGAWAVAVDGEQIEAVA